MSKLDIYISFWGFSISDKDNLSQKVKDILDMTVVAFSYAKRNHKNIYLVTDSKSKQLFDHIPFTKIYTDLDSLYDIDKRYQKYWSLGKIKTIQLACKAKKPFVQIDYDVFIQNTLPSRLENAAVFCQSPEPVSHTFAYNLNMFYDIYGYLGAASNRTEISYNCGIVGGNDLSFLKKYADSVFEFVMHIDNQKALDLNFSNKENAASYSYYIFEQYNIIPDEIPSFQLAIWAEQYYLACMLKQEKIDVELLFNTWDPNDYVNIKTANECGYVHLLESKNDQEKMDQVRQISKIAIDNNFKI